MKSTQLTLKKSESTAGWFHHAPLTMKTIIQKVRLLCAWTINDINIKHTPGTCECPLFCGFSPTIQKNVLQMKKHPGHVFSINICNTNTYTYIRYILTFLGTNISHLWKRTIIFPAAFKRDTCFFPGGYSIFGGFHDPSQ